MTLQNELEKSRIGLSIGLISQKEFIQWVDEQIAKLDAPPYCLIDIAYNSLVPQERLVKIVYNILTEDFHRADMNYKQIKSNLFSILRQSYLRSEINLEKGVSTLFQMLSCFFSDHDDFYNMISLSDMYELAKNKIYGSLEDVERRFLELIGN